MCQGDISGYLPSPPNFPLPGETSGEGAEGRGGEQRLGSGGLRVKAGAEGSRGSKELVGVKDSTDQTLHGLVGGAASHSTC